MHWNPRYSPIRLGGSVPAGRLEPPGAGQMQAIISEIQALQADAERRIARMRAGPARDQLVEQVDRLRELRDRIVREGSTISRESAQSLLREIRAG